MKDKNHISPFDDDGGMSLTCGICKIKVRSCQTFNNERWNDHVYTKVHLRKIASSMCKQNNNNMIRPTSSQKDPFSELKELSAPKISPGIHEGHQYLSLMISFGKYEDFNVRFICERYGQVVKAMHMECNGEYQIG